jgi:transcription-repair coupling factor (superfamily II helicase)
MAVPTTPPTAPRTEPTPAGVGVRLLGLPTVARLARFARAEGPAVLLTTAERAAAFRDAPVFGATVGFDPTLADWHDRHEKVVLTLGHALRPFPADPERYALELRLGIRAARDELLERLVRYGFDRDAVPGFTVRGDTVDLFLGADPERDHVRLSFFGDELDGLERDGAPIEALVLGPRDLERLVADEEEGDDPEAWTSTVLEACAGAVFLDAPELIEGELGADAAARLFELVAGRRPTSFGRDPLPLEAQVPPEASLGYYRARLDEFAGDAETWLRDGYSVHVLLKF